MDDAGGAARRGADEADADAIELAHHAGWHQGAAVAVVHVGGDEREACAGKAAEGPAQL
jgi:electron transfer flavoprotein alpha/beta subunit